MLLLSNLTADRLVEFARLVQDQSANTKNDSFEECGESMLCGNRQQNLLKLSEQLTALFDVIESIKRINDLESQILQKKSVKYGL